MSKNEQCPYCQSKSIHQEVAFWNSWSIQDPTNHAELSESQCCDCGLSFWIPAYTKEQSK